MCSWTMAFIIAALLFVTLANFVDHEPYASKIVDVNNGLRLNGESLRQIFLQEEIKEKKVCVISIAGAFRQGKSFLLNFFLRYLTLTSNRRENLQKWLSPEDGPITGFSWKGGSDTVTNGILIWSEVFVRQLPSGEEVVVVLMDTQGSFDNESTMRHCAAIFALSTLLSSVQIYNLKENIKSSDLAHLQFFLSYGQLLKQAGNDERPFQNLTFLIRDWATPEEYPYGLEGGDLLLKKVLNTNDTKVSKELIALRRGINELFDDIKCFLMPHPGLKVTKLNFSGRLEDIDEEFKNYVETLAHVLFAPENLIPKVINGEYVRVKHLVNLFEDYCEQFKSKDMPDVESLFKATANAQHMVVLEEAETKYDEAMAFIKNDDFEGMDNQDLEKEHQKSKNIALGYFLTKKIIGGEEMKQQNAKALEQKLDEKFNTEYKIFNDLGLTKAKLEKMLEEQKSKITQLESTLLEEQKMMQTIHGETDQQKKKIAELQKIIEQEKSQQDSLRNEIEIINNKRRKNPIDKIIRGFGEVAEGILSIVGLI